MNLDFGAGAFSGSARWLDITITNGGTTQTLSPRVQVSPTPYAQFAAVAAAVTNGAIMNAQLAANAVNANNIASGQVVKSLNGLTDAVLLSAGTNVTLTTNGGALQISAAASGGVVVTNALAAGNNVGLFTNSGIVQISSFVPNIQLFRSVTNATFTAPTNVTRIMVEMWGAGGGGGNGYNDGVNFYSGGGGGAGNYAMNVFTVTPGAAFSATAPGASSAGQPGGTASFGGLMSASGGSAGANATASGNGAGGAGGTSSGSLFNGLLAQPGGSGNNPGEYGGGGYGGQVFRGGVQNGASGPGGGGSGGGPGSPGNAGSSGLVLVYY